MSKGWALIRGVGAYSRVGTYSRGRLFEALRYVHFSLSLTLLTLILKINEKSTRLNFTKGFKLLVRYLGDFLIFLHKIYLVARYYLLRDADIKNLIISAL